MAKVYLDTSAFAKRYVKEEGSDLVDSVFEKSSTQNQIVISFWNLGEALVVFDKYRNRGHLTDEQLKGVIQNMLTEVRDLLHKGFMVVVPVSVQVLAGSWNFILDQHIYAGDAVQLGTFKQESCDFLLAADRKFLQVCKKVGVDGFDVEKKTDVDKVMNRLKK